jgi:ketosteroid isomerase-like protein
MGRHTRAELEDAFAGYQRLAAEAGRTQDWNAWADQFTEDATYVEHLFGTFHGREEIRRWITRTMTSFPGNAMPSFPVEWYLIDEDRGWVVFEVWNPMRDPGDGSVHRASNISIIHYAGDGQWSYEEDVYNPSDFTVMIEAWCRRAEELGRLPDDARAWLQLIGRPAGGPVPS